MFSGKTSMLQKYIHTYSCIDKKVIVINHSFDTRYGEQILSNHNGYKIPAHMVNDLNNLPENIINEINEADLITINEGQFFENSLTEFCMNWREKGKDIVISALDGDYKQEMFPEIIKILPKVDNYIKLTAKCISCKDGTNASYTFRKTKDKEQIIVGNQDIYIPLCWKCGKNIN